MISLKLATLTVVLLGAATVSVSSTEIVDVTLDSKFLSDSHYEKPPCGSDEKAVRIMGVDGVFCSPSCADGPCPADVPDGVSAKPLCALQSPQGDKFCAILCKPSVYTNFLRVNGVVADDITGGGGECGPMTCTPIPQAAGMGICVYDSSSVLEDTATTVMEVA